MATSPEVELNNIEQIVKIRQLLINAERKQQEIRFAPWQLAIGGLTSGAAIFAAGAAFSKAFF